MLYKSTILTHCYDTSRTEPWNDNMEISRLKENLSKEFEVKDFGQLKYFPSIEMARFPKGIVFSQRKYVLDLLSDTGMLGCQAASTPIDQNHKLRV